MDLRTLIWKVVGIVVEHVFNWKKNALHIYFKWV